MISVHHPHRAHKSLPLYDAHSVPKHDPSISTTRAILRTHSLPTPAPSPSPSLSSTSSAFSSPLPSMLALDDSRSLSPFAPTFNPLPSRLRAMRQYMPVTPDNSCLALPSLEYEQFDAFSVSKSRVVRLSNLPSSPDDDASSAHALVSLFPLFFFHPSVGANGGAAETPTPLKMWTVRPNAVVRDGEQRPVWAVFASHEEACAALRLSASAYDIGLRSGSIGITPALEAELEPFAKLQAFDLKMLCNSTTPTNRSTSQSAAASMGMGMQSLMRYPPSPTSTNDTEAETEAELFFPDGGDEYEFAYGNAQGLGCGFRNGDAAAAVRELQALQMMQACGYMLSTNPPKARTGTGFRQGDWICSVPVCAAHNFGRNVTCIQCSAPRPTNCAGLGGGGYVNYPVCSNGQLNARGLPYANALGAARNASPRFANTMNSVSSHVFGHGHGQAQVQAQALSQQARHAQQQQHPHPYPKSQVQAAQAQGQGQGQAQTHPLLTPSGRAFAAGGKVQNISSDPLAPCIMFWPDNEALPDPGQIRPATLAAIPQPPIMNTGNKGPIEKQPGDWVCLKCDYLNWRRRKVCQTCYPYAEGNGDSVSATMHAERLAILTAVYGQSHSPQGNSAHTQSAPQFKGQAQNFSDSYQAPIASTAAPSQRSSSVLSNKNNNTSSLSMLSGYPYSTSPSSHRSEYHSEPARRLSIPSLSVSTSVNNSRAASGPVGGMSQVAQAVAARRAVSSPESAIGPGSIVYQTPPSPAAARPPASVSSGLAALDPSPTRAGSLLPSFLKQEMQPQPLRGVSRPFTNANTPSAGPGPGSRTPASLSPASSTSADLPVDENDGLQRSVGVIGSGRSAGFYAHPRGAGSGSSMGSSSSLTLSGGSIWSIAHNEDKSWNSGNAFATVEALKGLTL